MVLQLTHRGTSSGNPPTNTNGHRQSCASEGCGECSVQTPGARRPPSDSPPTRSAGPAPSRRAPSLPLPPWMPHMPRRASRWSAPRRPRRGRLADSRPPTGPANPLVSRHTVPKAKPQATGRARKGALPPVDYPHVLVPVAEGGGAGGGGGGGQTEGEGPSGGGRRGWPARARAARGTPPTVLSGGGGGGGRGGGEGGGKPSAIARAAAAAGSQEHPQTCQTSMCGASKTRPAVEGGEAGRVPHGKTATLGLWGRAHRGVVSKGDRTAAVGLPNRAKKENCRVLPRAGRHTGGREKKREPHSHGQAVTAANVPVPNFPKRLPTLGAVEGTCPVMNGPHVLAVKVSPHPRPQQPPRSPQPPPHMQQGVGETQSTEASTSKSVSALDSAAARHTTRPLVRESRAPWQVDSSDRRAPPPGGASARRPSNQRGRGEPARRPGRPAQGRWTRTLAGRCRQAAPSRPPRLAVRPPLSPRHPPPQ